MKEPTRKMTPEERQAKVDSLTEKLDKLPIDSLQRILEAIREIRTTRNLAIIGQQDIRLFCDPLNKGVIQALQDKHKGGDPLLLLCDVFNYGYIQGKRAERARKKARECKKAQGGQQTEPAHQENPTR